MTDTDTRAALDAAILRVVHTATRDGIGIDASNVLDSRPSTITDARVAELHAAITAHVDAEVTRRLAAAPSVEEAIAASVDGAFKYGQASTLKHAHLLTITPDWTVPILRAAITADRDRAIREHDATWQAHDLERDTEVARWQGEAHALVRAVKSIAAAVGAPDVEGGDGWAERAAAVIGKATRPTPDEARRLVGEFAGAHGAMVAHLAGMTGPESGEDVAARAESTRTALLRALGVEA